jgi:hypothetical protein|tara:strand:+ start:159 stop:752 length:594 start_codon:yes stop_codon:yes gene_type:complete
MEWFLLTSKNTPNAASLRRFMKQHGAQRVINASMLDTLIAMRNGEQRWLDRIKSAEKFTWRFAQSPTETYEARCGAEVLFENQKRRHETACISCNKIKDPNWQPAPRIHKPKQAPPSTEPSPNGVATTEVTPANSLDRLLSEMGKARDYHLHMATEYDNVIEAAKGLNDYQKERDALESKMLEHRKSLSVFVKASEE